ncbi:Putative inner membrane exporter, YdcZ [Candidatus Nanopelagicaceae bacterium]
MTSKENQRLDILATISGVMIALQARANGELSHRLDNGVEAALISFGSGLFIIALFALFSPAIKEGARNLRGAVARKELPRWTLFAGALGGTFVGIQTHVVPVIGVAIYSVASIAGQTTASLLVDRLGITGGGKKHITARRLAAAAFTVFAVFISVYDRIEASDLAIFAVFLAGVAGAVVGVQRALNGQINEHSHQSFTTSLLNFIMGTTFLTLLLTLLLILGDTKVSALPAGPWWIYTGGVIGVIYIAFTSKIVQHLGVLTFTLFSVGGNLLGSLLIDLISPTDGVRVSWYLVIGIAMTYLGVIVGGVNNSQSRKPLKR